MLLYTVRKLGLRISDTIFVGDSQSDYYAAQSAGILYHQVASGLPEIAPSTYEASTHEDFPSFVRWYSDANQNLF